MDLTNLLEMAPWDWPPDTGKRFLSVLGNRQAGSEDRLIAAQHAGDLVVVNDALCDALIRVAGSAEETEELRAAAAVSLGPVLDQADTEGFEDDDYSGVPITEKTFHRIQAALQQLYSDESLPKLVRRRILEASVRAPQDWQREAIDRAYSSGDRDWMLTAVFAMQYVRGFDRQILEALSSSDSDIHYEAVIAAGNGELDAAWDHVLALALDPDTPKPLVFEAIGAVADIRPQEAPDALADLLESPDQEIVEATSEALAMASGEDFEDDEDEDFSGLG